jgi:lactoylglutathione lyase
MIIEHIAIWAKDLEALKDFYIRFFGAKPNKKYLNSLKNFESYFLSFESGARLELMQMPGVENSMHQAESQYMGLTHLAFSTGSRRQVDDLTEELRQQGYRIVSEPRTTGDGYYESVILDPEGNRIEISA